MSAISQIALRMTTGAPIDSARPVVLSRLRVSVDHSLKRRALTEAAWLAFYLPRGGLQALARRLPLDRLRDQLPRRLAEQLRFSLYPARITDATEKRCATAYAPWGDPADLDPSRPVRYDGTPRTSLLMVTHGNEALTRLCLRSLQEAAGAVSFEVIAVDNGSPVGDGTAAYLERAASSGILPLRVVLNRDNRGFSAANNQAAGLARGEILVLLNNDTVVVPGWLERLVGHLERDRSLGLVGPRTNACGNEAALGTPYGDLDGMFAFARARPETPCARDLEMLTLFCAAIPARLWGEVGGLDERYRLGMFEDDDLAMAVRRAGRRVAVCEDVFVHHYGGASFSQLPPRTYLRVWWENRRRYVAKWGVAWKPR
jgi:GT2 family glycosyltransferase